VVLRFEFGARQAPWVYSYVPFLPFKGDDVKLWTHPQEELRLSIVLAMAALHQLMSSEYRGITLMVRKIWIGGMYVTRTSNMLAPNSSKAINCELQAAGDISYAACRGRPAPRRTCCANVTTTSPARTRNVI
jgi:hypothetical protein